MSPVDLTDLEAARLRLEELARRAMDLAAGQGADQAEVSASLTTGLSVTVRRGEVETLEHQRDRGFGVTVYGLREDSGRVSTHPGHSRMSMRSISGSVVRPTSTDDPSGATSNPAISPGVSESLTASGASKRISEADRRAIE